MDKKILIQNLLHALDVRISVLANNIESLKEARNNETKSSVGDKYETGRAMAQMELEKNQEQLSQTENRKTTLLRINPETQHDTVEFGSLVKTNQNTYFISIPMGKIELKEEAVYCLSPVSPISRILSGRKAGDTVTFQDKNIQIRQII